MAERLTVEKAREWIIDTYIDRLSKAKTYSDVYKIVKEAYKLLGETIPEKEFAKLPRKIREYVRRAISEIKTEEEEAKRRKAEARREREEKARELLGELFERMGIKEEKPKKREEERIVIKVPEEAEEEVEKVERKPLIAIKIEEAPEKAVPGVELSPETEEIVEEISKVIPYDRCLQLLIALNKVVMEGGKRRAQKIQKMANEIIRNISAIGCFVPSAETMFNFVRFTEESEDWKKKIEAEFKNTLNDALFRVEKLAEKIANKEAEIESVITEAKRIKDRLSEINSLLDKIRANPELLESSIDLAEKLREYKDEIVSMMLLIDDINAKLKERGATLDEVYAVLTKLTDNIDKVRKIIEEAEELTTKLKEAKFKLREAKLTPEELEIIATIAKEIKTREDKISALLAAIDRISELVERKGLSFEDALYRIVEIIEKM